MEARFTNGASVNRSFGDQESAELLAVFQYSSDAEEYARRKLAEDAERKWLGSRYIVTDHHSACVKVIQHKPEKAQS
jgi:hypothetical protein